MARLKIVISGNKLMAWWIVFFFALTSPLPALASTPADSILVATQGKPRASIVLAENAGETYRYAATELQKYLHTLSGAEIQIISDSQVSSIPRQEALLFVGGSAVNSAIPRTALNLQLKLKGIKTGGFVIETGRIRNHAVIAVAGNDGVSTMYGVYELIERLGVTFRITGDIVPKPQDSLSIPRISLRQEPAFQRRGFLLQDGGYENLTMFSYQDYAKLIDQMAKMKCNYLQFWWFAFEPWLNFSYQGESKWMGDVSTKESGYLTWAHGGFGSRTTDDVTIGKHWFTAGKRIAPPEMQAVETPGQAFHVANNLLRRIIHHAHERGIEVWPAIEIASLPPNLARYCERTGDLPFNRIFGTFVQPLDKTCREIQASRLRALITTYPEADGYFLVFPEAYPQINTEKYRSFFNQMRPKFFALRRLHWPWIVDTPLGADRMVDSNIGYFDLFQYLLKVRNQIEPKAKIGLMGIGRGYALPVFDKMLPRDIPFTDMESSGVWTPTGVPMQDFGGMGNRERTIEPRIDDDADMMGMQFNVTQYADDRIVTDGVKYGLSGFAGQLNRARGTETNTLFLAEAAWSPSLTPEMFYKEYSTRVFGENASSGMYDAFMDLEKNDRYLGYYNYDYSPMNCCGALPEVNAAYEYSRQPDPYHGPTTSDWKRFIAGSPDVIKRYEGSIRLLNKALGNMQAALPKSAPRGQYELHYMIIRTQSYRDYLQSLITIRKAYLSFDGAFAGKNRVAHNEFIQHLAASLNQFQVAEDQVKAATREYARIIDHPSDLGVLYHLNARAVLGFTLVQQWMQNVVNFQNGKDYMRHVAFERLYSPVP